MTLMPLRRSMDLNATACSRFLVNLENFQTNISLKGASGFLASSIILLNWGLLAILPLSASSTYSRTTRKLFSWRGHAAPATVRPRTNPHPAFRWTPWRTVPPA